MLFIDPKQIFAKNAKALHYIDIVCELSKNGEKVHGVKDRLLRLEL